MYQEHRILGTITTGDSVSEPGFAMSLSVSSKKKKPQMKYIHCVSEAVDVGGTGLWCSLLGSVVPSKSSNHSFLKRNVKLLLLSREQMLC